MLEIIIIASLCVSNLVTGAFLFKYFKKSKENPNESKLDLDATDLLTQLMKGGAVVVTGVINKEELFMWSPRNRA
jgi:hypothetical protein